ncbi:hypothetical protein [Corynebacterium matruchotii]|uniref:Uncharacterized protein n=2 Tax=Corynebacterium matruchotii TaxID=43768 RepID=E0DIA2_9CORY|nr:hypothetical protein [Corynebacterium matruchotii]EFM48002.1 hypothetical protein HMPREF0299_5413 [Corynebacterium matruchotii ATCC 14266]KAB1926606.1 hypothetical protein F8196_01335 [Corynebacterium matruchotii]QIP46107.1 hypothetical protein HBA49_11760 [Corynebacterium matruchotii]SPW34418.1 Uncharacterised protein [Corynebacterium matruchotii]
MSYRDLAAQQRGFLLRSQLSEEEIQEARDTGFIIEGGFLDSNNGFYTQLSGHSPNDSSYWLWLLAFPAIPPERRNPMPYVASSEALQIRGIGRIGSGDPACIITPPELMPYANIEEGVTDEFIVDDNIQPTDWSLVDDIPTENILPALRKYLMTTDDFEYAADATLDAHYYGCSWEELAEVLEVCAGTWTDKNGRKPRTGKEVLDHFLSEYASPYPNTNKDYDDDDDDW